MSDKERLEDIKSRYMEHEYDFNLKNVDIKWLIKQAERVEELEKALDLTEWQYAGEKNLAEKLKVENKRYREALMKILNTGTFGTDIHTGKVVRKKEAEIAFKALEEANDQAN